MRRVRGIHILALVAIASALSLGAAETNSKPHPPELVASSGARILRIVNDGWAGSPVDGLAGEQNALVTDGSTQYAAFYAADARLVLARRELGSDNWITQRTERHGRVADAPEPVALGIDGAGFIHVAWDHEASPLNYSRSVAPGSLELGSAQPMMGQHESQVTSPAFLRLPGGDLLFLYRDGVSGQGHWVLNRYSVRDNRWSQVQSDLIDGEGKSSASVSAAIDAKGGLHLAWVGRDSTDVATNHDLCYARSLDGGVTWTTSTGTPLALPLTEKNADYAARIGAACSFMNSPSLALDRDGQPYLADYWCPEGSDVPQYQVVFRESGKWRILQVTQRTTSLVVAGTAGKVPPPSRSAFFVATNLKNQPTLYLVYRDDDRGGRVVVAECRDVSQPHWTVRELTAGSVGTWEPSVDPMQWSRFNQQHFLLQNVQPREANEVAATTAPPTTVATLLWSPFAAGLGVATGEPPVATAGQFSQSIDPAAVVTVMEHAADWQLAQKPTRDPAGWENAPFYIGTLALSRISRSPKYHDAMIAWAEANQWLPAKRVYHADDHCVMQAYLELYRRHSDPRMLAPSRARLDEILAHPVSTGLEWGTPGVQDRWSWCDALFMGPTSWLMMYEATADQRYLDFMNREWWATVSALYVPGDRLFARDESFLDLRERNGRGLYWARGNGWVAAGLARVLDIFPANHPDRPRYVALYRNMMEAVLAAQQPGGLWRPGLLDPASHPVRETSGSSFYTFALAWGVNRGLLDRARFEPAARRGWLALMDCVLPNGKLEQVQPVGAAPEGFDPHHTEPFGVGAFLLAGSEIYRLVGGAAPEPYPHQPCRFMFASNAALNFLGFP